MEPVCGVVGDGGSSARCLHGGGVRPMGNSGEETSPVVVEAGSWVGEEQYIDAVHVAAMTEADGGRRGVVRYEAFAAKERMVLGGFGPSSRRRNSARGVQLRSTGMLCRTRGFSRVAWCGGSARARGAARRGGEEQR
jgi:hypothetical protein